MKQTECLHPPEKLQITDRPNVRICGECGKEIIIMVKGEPS